MMPLSNIKVKISNLLILLTGIYLITSIHEVELIRPVFAFMRLFRLAMIPLFVFLGAVLITQQSERKVKSLIMLVLPVVLLLAVNMLQLVALPPELAITHATLSTRFTSLFLLYFCILLSINNVSVDRLIKVLLTLLIGLFAVGVIQYPFNIASAGGSLIQALAGYGQVGDRYQIGGILGHANENANGCITLFPLALLWVEEKKGLKRLLWRWTLFLSFALALVFNGTRTALVISLPLLSYLFYTDLSVKKVFYSLIPISVFGTMGLLFKDAIVQKFFAEEASGGGTLGWRIEHVWAPVSRYTLTHSPLFGFGARGWDFVGHQLDLMEPVTQMLAPAHNGFVWCLVSWGLLGLSAYVAFIAVLLVESFSLAQSRIISIANPGKALFCSMVGYCIWAMISNVMFTIGWQILVDLAMLIAAFKCLEGVIQRQSLELPSMPPGNPVPDI